MKSRNPLVGRHFAGTPVGGNRTKPPARTGSASGSGVGTGVNQKTAANPQYTRSGSASNRDYKTQVEQFTRQSPEPFRDKQPAVNPNPLPPQQSGDGVGRGGAYKPFKGSRVSVDDGYREVNRAAEGRNTAPVGVTGSRGRGSENGKVAGTSQPRKIGPAGLPKGSNRPAFYGR